MSICELYHILRSKITKVLLNFFQKIAGFPKGTCPLVFAGTKHKKTGFAIAKPALSVISLVSFGIHANLLFVSALAFKLHVAVNKRKQCVVSAASNVVTRIQLCSALTH